ncbi:hypothetical protein PC9H_009649 [Pleurotus ostreatus]|uniref:DUF572-domain-containing protein n=2 Tax=Pleurotus ostreatus TaxID=5322 RepID=A0A067NLW9_PLEO1|nr:uncharacterized protein PC9H_009649 [Pleurotus ostreatus]KAF7424342.1 hypothetical protein PC9H_009649 [Pleurotus ostreatus]KAJ8692747.1 Protein saf4 [Pleurotus ostreatus]KDQ24596.1 hypothetical protein PLEOSDRAFT_174504 [Pleurotus ostreatus PC15]
MQGFNKYYPPDYDGEKHKSLNSYRGKHALGDRARKIDQGILITRFELPFNIWCGTCNNHIGMGVRYNAEKKKIGNYYSTPIYSFRCKCHLCDGWFEIQTDPKNTQYVVTSGARRKEEDWNPEENGGYAVHDTEGSAAPVDPLAVLEKTTDAQKNLTQVQIPRLEGLQNVSEQYNSDPYTLSRKVRKRFREVKKAALEKEAADDSLKGRYGLPETLKLLDEAEDDAIHAKEEWKQARKELAEEASSKRRRLVLTSVSRPTPSLPSSSSRVSTTSGTDAVSALRARVLGNTARRGRQR